MEEDLFSTRFGSYLYGTNLPTSDIDRKIIYAPSLADLLIGKRIKNQPSKTQSQADLIKRDDERIPIQVFARDFVAGKSYAVELAYAMLYDQAHQAISPVHQRFFSSFTQDLRERFLTTNSIKTINYALNEISYHSQDTDQLGVLEEIIKVFDDIKGFYDTARTTIEDVYVTNPLTDPLDTEHSPTDELNLLLDKYPKHFQLARLDTGEFIQRPCFVILSKDFPFFITLDNAFNAFNALRDQLKSQRQHSRNRTDQKTMMHVFRLLDESITLLNGQPLVFPYNQSYIKKLLAIRAGDIPVDTVRAEIESKIGVLRELEHSSRLPREIDVQGEFNDWLAMQMMKLYINGYGCE